MKIDIASKTAVHGKMVSSPHSTPPHSGKGKGTLATSASMDHKAKAKQATVHISKVAGTTVSKTKSSSSKIAGSTVVPKDGKAKVKVRFGEKTAIKTKTKLATKPKTITIPTAGKTSTIGGKHGSTVDPEKIKTAPKAAPTGKTKIPARVVQKETASSTKSKLKIQTSLPSAKAAGGKVKMSEVKIPSKIATARQIAAKAIASGSSKGTKPAMEDVKIEKDIRKIKRTVKIATKTIISPAEEIPHKVVQKHLMTKPVVSGPTPLIGPQLPLKKPPPEGFIGPRMLIGPLPKPVASREKIAKPELVIPLAEKSGARPESTIKLKSMLEHEAKAAPIIEAKTAKWDPQPSPRPSTGATRTHIRAEKATSKSALKTKSKSSTERMPSKERTETKFVPRAAIKRPAPSPKVKPRKMMISEEIRSDMIFSDLAEVPVVLTPKSAADSKEVKVKPSRSTPHSGKLKSVLPPVEEAKSRTLSVDEPKGTGDSKTSDSKAETIKVEVKILPDVKPLAANFKAEAIQKQTPTSIKLHSKTVTSIPAPKKAATKTTSKSKVEHQVRVQPATSKAIPVANAVTPQMAVSHINSKVTSKFSKQAIRSDSLQRSSSFAGPKYFQEIINSAQNVDSPSKIDKKQRFSSKTGRIGTVSMNNEITAKPDNDQLNPLMYATVLITVFACSLMSVPVSYLTRPNNSSLANTATPEKSFRTDNMVTQQIQPDPIEPSILVSLHPNASANGHLASDQDNVTEKQLNLILADLEFYKKELNRKSKRMDEYIQKTKEEINDLKTIVDKLAQKYNSIKTENEQCMQQFQKSQEKCNNLEKNLEIAKQEIAVLQLQQSCSQQSDSDSPACNSPHSSPTIRETGNILPDLQSQRSYVNDVLENVGELLKERKSEIKALNNVIEQLQISSDESGG